MRDRVLIIGSGAREHALAYRLSQDAQGSLMREVLIAPGNDGASLSIPCLKPNGDKVEDFVSLAKSVKPNLIVIGPEEPLALGLSDVLEEEGFTVFGPSQKAAQIESSKSFMKQVAVAAKIPTASFHRFTFENEAQNFVKEQKFPLVIKADGLCAGKGVVVAQELTEAKDAISRLISLGPIIVEEFLRGVEMSVIALCTEDDAILFPPVQDHKRLLDGDKGPNTGGMGVVGPHPQYTGMKFLSRLKETFFLPTLNQLKKQGCPFRGALFAGLMVDGDNAKLLEFNARFGDPETQALAYGTDVDWYPILRDIANGRRLSDHAEDVFTKMRPTASITMAAKGYPISPERGDSIELSSQSKINGRVFFSSVARNADGGLITNGGRILSCVARAESLRMAIAKSYDIVSGISFRGAQYRKDIGRDFL